MQNTRQQRTRSRGPSINRASLKNTRVVSSTEILNTEVRTKSLSNFGDWESDAPNEVVITTGNELGTFMGVFLPCLLSIFGVVIFLQLGVSVGQAGIIASVAMFLLASFIVLLTVLSLSAIATNGTIRGGGAYFMISRALGPEFGGGIGLLFYLANSVGSTFYVTGFATEIVSDHGGLGLSIVGNHYWDTFLVASMAQFFCLVVALLGADAFAKVSFFIFLAVTFSIGLSIIALLAQPVGHISGFTQINSTTFSSNLWPDPNPTIQLGGVFSILFPAVTGVMAGANMSGDLKNPGQSIPKGTLWALGVAIITYLALLLLIATTFSHSAISNADRKLILAEIGFHPAIVATGIISSTISSALGAVVGGARVLQALARDNLIPILNFFAKGTPDKDEPQRAVLLTYFIGQMFLFLGNLDTISSIISNFFLLSYGVTNLACFGLKITGAPNFRPQFRYFTWKTSLLGFLCCLSIMFYTNAAFATVAILCFCFIWGYVHFKSPATAWGDISQAIIYHQVRKYMLQLDQRKEHAKFWRPQVLLLLTNSASASMGLIHFCNSLKKGGLYVIGIVRQGEIETEGPKIQNVYDSLQELIDVAPVKAFPEVVLSPTLRLGSQNLMMMAGLAGMKPNTVVFEFPESLLERKFTSHRSSSLDTSQAFPPIKSKNSVNQNELKVPLVGSAGLSENERELRIRAVSLGFSTERKSQNLENSLEVVDRLDRWLDTTAAPSGAKNVEEFINMIRDAVVLKKNVCVGRNFSALPHLQVSENSHQLTIDMFSGMDGWLLKNQSIDPSQSLVLQLGYIISRTDFWRKNKVILRVFSLVLREEQMKSEAEKLNTLLNRARIRAQPIVFSLEKELAELSSWGGKSAKEASDLCKSLKDNVGQYRTLPLRSQYLIQNHLLQRHSTNTGVLITILPSLQRDMNDAEISSIIDVFSQGLPPTLMTTGHANVLTFDL